MSQNENRIIFADVLRILATFFVIVYHVATDKWMFTYTNSFNWYFLTFLTSELRWCVPVFFMLSGMTFLNPEKEVSIKKLYTKNIPHILIALIFWSILYKILAIIVRQIQGIQNFELNTLKQIIINIFFEPAWMHLWFLYTLIAIYMLVPILRVYTKNTTKENYLYLLILYLLTLGIIPIIENIIGRQILLFKITEIYGYTMYFMVGWYLFNYKINKTHTKIIYVLGIISSVCMFSISSFVSYKYQGPYIPIIFDYLSITNIFIASSIFLFFKNWFDNHTQQSNTLKNNSFIRLLSNCCFGIYLVHMISFNMIYPIYEKVLKYNQLSTILITPFVIFILSFIIILIIKKIPYLNKWIV